MHSILDSGLQTLQASQASSFGSEEFVKPTLTKERLARLATTEDKLKSRNGSVSSKSSRSATSSKRRKNANLRNLLENIKSQENDNESSIRQKESQNEFNTFTSSNAFTSTIAEPLKAADLVTCEKQYMDRTADSNLNLNLDDLQKRIQGLEQKLNEDSTRMASQPNIPSFQAVLRESKAKLESVIPTTTFSQAMPNSARAPLPQKPESTIKNRQFECSMQKALEIKARLVQTDQKIKIDDHANSVMKAKYSSSDSESSQESDCEKQRQQQLTQNSKLLQKDKIKSKRSENNLNQRKNLRAIEKKSDSLERLQKATRKIQNQIESLQTRQPGAKKKTPKAAKTLKKSGHSRSNSLQHSRLSSTASKTSERHSLRSSHSMTGLNRSYVTRKLTKVPGEQEDLKSSRSVSVRRQGATSARYEQEKDKFESNLRVKRAEEKAEKYRKLAKAAKEEVVQERKKNAKLQMALDCQHNYGGGDSEALQMELVELRKCFEKSEQVRKQQKMLIQRMKTQIEDLHKEKEARPAQAPVKMKRRSRSRNGEKKSLTTCSASTIEKPKKKKIKQNLN